MIILGNRVFNPIKAFDSDEKLWGYLQVQANRKPDGDEDGHDKWRFAYYPHHMLKDFTQMMDIENFRTLAQQSVKQQLNMIVIYQGDPQNPQCFLVTPDLDAVRLKKNWCKAYAATHGLQIIER